MFKNYFEKLTDSAIILTPNRRLATILHGQYLEFKKQQNIISWPKPTIFSINAWIENVWNNYLATATIDAPYLLNNVQAQAIWELVVSEDTTHHLLQIAETANSLKSAWELIHQYKVTIEDPAFQLTDDYALFKKWLLQYQRICEENNYIDSATLPDFLIAKSTTGDIALPDKILLYGFTEIVPQHHQLLSSQNIVNIISARKLPDNHATRTQFFDPDSEIIAMARFAKEKHESNPNATIGCVLLDLSQRRERVLQLFTQVFFPEQPYDIDAAHYPFNISAGKKLGSYPIIAIALLITGLTNGNMTREQFSAILLSPYIGDAENEGNKRAKYDADLRSKNIHQISLKTLSGDCSLLLKRIKQLMPLLENKKCSYHEWSQHFNNMLAILGWPGEKSLSSEEYQVAHAWLTALNQLSSLDAVATPVTKQEAWQHLRQIINAQIFQPQSPQTNIQVLGLLEAAAVPFDYLWVAGLNDLSWPPQPAPHPFIPKQLQRRLNMPHATAERELRFCTTILEQFQQSNQQIIFSYAESDGKINYSVSPLIQQTPTIPVNELMTSAYVDPASIIFLTRQSETFEDAMAPAIPPQQKMAGGADVIKQQAACPFRAFATYRLQARKLEKSTQGLNHKDRGIIIHEVLQRIWDDIKSQEKLLSIGEDTLNILVNDAIMIVTSKSAPSHHQDSNYLALERQRLNRIILQWLALEKSRPAFTVTTQEQNATIELDGRSLSVRIDRIDTLADGHKLIIDYKSGKYNSVNKWYGDRPDEPQLPLYALIDPDNTVGISFAQLAAGNIRYNGVSHTELNINGIKTEVDTWHEQLKKWQTTFRKLVVDFCEGHAEVDPKRPAVTCKDCPTTPLCRIYETADPTYDDPAASEDE